MAKIQKPGLNPAFVRIYDDLRQLLLHHFPVLIKFNHLGLCIFFNGYLKILGAAGFNKKS